MAVGKGILWNGKYFSLPQAASRVDSSALSPVQLGNDGVVALLGDFTGLVQPLTATKVGNAPTAKNLIAPGYANGDEAQLATNLLFSPSSEMAGASEVYLVPVCTATQATATIDSKITLTSYLYGLVANQVKYKVESATTAGKKVTVGYGDTTEVFDNITKTQFTLLYTGSGTPATVTIALSAGSGSLTTSCTGATSDNLDLPFATYNTVQKLVDAIQATGKYTVASVLEPTFSTVNLDAVSAASILTTACSIKSDLYAIVETINTKCGYATAAKVTNAGAVPANTTSGVWAYLSGATYTAATNSDWTNALTLLRGMDVDIIVPLTSTASIHSSVADHCTEMSNTANKAERRAFVGGVNQSSWVEANRSGYITTISAAARTLNNDRVVFTGIGSKHYNALGTLTLYPGYITACMYAGMAAGASPVMPLTRKSLNCIGLEVELRTSEVNDLIEAGVAVPIPDRVQGAGYVVSRQVTTWSKDADLYRIEYSVGRGADYIAAQVRARHELLIGQPGSEGMDATIKNITNGVLAAAKRDGYVRDYDPKATQLRVDGVTRYIDYSAIPIVPINWIFGTYHLQPVTFVL